jgi:serine/threonine protein kinase
MAAFQGEVRKLFSLNHPHIQQLFGVMCDELGFVTELAQGGSLFERLHESLSPHLPVADLWAVATQLAQAVAYIHSKGVLHSDIKSDNVLLLNRGASGAAAVHIKLADFGFAQTVSITSASVTAVGKTWRYAAPELADDKVSFKSDVWSFGCVLCEIFSPTFARPWESLLKEIAIMKQVMNGQAPPEIKAIPMTVFGWLPSSACRRTRRSALRCSKWWTSWRLRAQVCTCKTVPRSNKSRQRQRRKRRTLWRPKG